MENSLQSLLNPYTTPEPECLSSVFTWALRYFSHEDAKVLANFPKCSNSKGGTWFIVYIYLTFTLVQHFKIDACYLTVGISSRISCVD